MTVWLDFRAKNELRLLLSAGIRNVFADLDRGNQREIVEARGVDHLDRRISDFISSFMDKRTDERAAESFRREKEEALREMEKFGNGRSAAMKVAKHWSRDPHTRQMLAQRFRRYRRLQCESEK